jgi:YD repeat-containing protein
MKKLICSLFLLFLLPFSFQTQAQKVTKYTYDALGRVTFVEDSNGNRDYDYDAAGNRLNVAISTANDQTSEPGMNSGLPAAPTGLYSQYSGNCYFRVSWTASTTSGVYYVLTDSKGYSQQINSTSTTFNCTYNSSPPDVKPASLKACISQSACSAVVYFN